MFTFPPLKSLSFKITEIWFSWWFFLPRLRLPRGFTGLRSSGLDDTSELFVIQDGAVNVQSWSFISAGSMAKSQDSQS